MDLQLMTLTVRALCLSPQTWAAGSPPRVAKRLRMLRSDICSRAATGGMRDSMEGRRVTSAFMSLSSSSSWFSTASKAGGIWGDACQTQQAERSRQLLAEKTQDGTPLGLADQVRVGNPSQPQSRLPQPCRHAPLCRTALAGLFPARDSLERCWWLSARHSTSASRAFSAMAG